MAMFPLRHTRTSEQGVVEQVPLETMGHLLVMVGVEPCFGSQAVQCSMPEEEEGHQINNGTWLDWAGLVGADTAITIRSPLLMVRTGWEEEEGRVYTTQCPVSSNRTPEEEGVLE